MTRFLARIVETIERHNMFRPGHRIGVAVSGGPDSVCLLHVLLELAPRWDLKIQVLHVNHLLRGEESRQDENFVRELAGRMGLNLRVREASVTGRGNLEQAARQARIEFFREVIAEGAVDVVALGHTRTDQAETVLFRFLRGAGTAGLAGIRPVTSDGVIRPLLGVDRAEVEQFLGSRQIAWREDSSNASLRFARNRIRHELLPQLARDWNPAIVETLAHTAEWAMAEEQYWDSLPIFTEAVEERGSAVLIRTDRLRELPLAAARRVLRKAVEHAKGDLRGVDFGHIAGILGLAFGSPGRGRFQAPGIEARRSFDWLRLARPGPGPGPFQFDITPPAVVPIPCTNRAISVEIIERSQSLRSQDCVYNGEMGCLDGGSLSGALMLRNWRPGDHYQPVGSTREQKLKALFQKARIPQWERGTWPVLTDRSSIVWSRRFGPAARVAANPESQTVLRVRETPL